MSVVCPSCGVENRDKARFCLGCAAPLDRAVEAPESPAARPARRRRAAPAAPVAEAHEAPGRGGALRAGGLVALVLVAALAGWWLLGRAPATVVSTVPQALAPATAQPLPADVLPVAASPGSEASETAVPAPSPAAVSAAERLRESVEALAQRDRAHQLELEQQRAKLAKELQRAEEARRRAEAPPLSQPLTTEPAQPAPASPPVTATAAATTAAPPAATVTTGATVDQICAGSGNFLARDFCRIRECGKPSFANDPVCVRFRQMDEARRQQSN